jgi:hypothetical protein
MHKKEECQEYSAVSGVVNIPLIVYIGGSQDQGPTMYVCMYVCMYVYFSSGSREAVKTS